MELGETVVVIAAQLRVPWPRYFDKPMLAWDEPQFLGGEKCNPGAKGCVVDPEEVRDELTAHAYK